MVGEARRYVLENVLDIADSVMLSYLERRRSAATEEACWISMVCLEVRGSIWGRVVFMGAA